MNLGQAIRLIESICFTVIFLRTETSVFMTEFSKRGSHSEAAWVSGSEAMVSHYTTLERQISSMRLHRRGLRKIATSPEQFSRFRQRLITSHAAMSAVHFILGKRKYM